MPVTQLWGNLDKNPEEKEIGTRHGTETWCLHNPELSKARTRAICGALPSSTPNH